MTSKTVALTMGDPLGIGPEVLVKALTKISTSSNCHFIIYGWRPAFESLASFDALCAQKNITFSELDGPAHFDRSQLSPKQAGKIAFQSLQEGVEGVKNGQVQALVTAPICKEHMQMAGFKYVGHTEYLCAEFDVKDFAMMLFHDKMRVVLTTIHCSLRQVFTQVTEKNIIRKLELISDGMTQLFGIKKPRVAVCGLNPHAGENGLMGDEELKIIRPAIKKFQKNKRFQHAVVSGPHAADVVFYKALRGDYDVVLCHYHDQGLIPLKTTGFESGVNLTLGLPFVRTSPDHGTAFDIAGKGVADSRSMEMALKAAVTLIPSGDEYKSPGLAPAK